MQNEHDEFDDVVAGELDERPGSRKVVGLVILSFALISAGVGYMIYTSMSQGSALEYFKNVDEVMEEPQKWVGQNVRLHGNVIAGTIQKKKDDGLNLRFAVYSGKKWVEVKYQGLVPDTFKDCAEVVVKGRLTPDGQLFNANNITAKCPSKYDSQDHANGCGNEHTSAVVASRK